MSHTKGFSIYQSVGICSGGRLCLILKDLVSTKHWYLLALHVFRRVLPKSVIDIRCNTTALQIGKRKPAYAMSQQMLLWIAGILEKNFLPRETEYIDIGGSIGYHFVYRLYQAA